ncbi:MAG TPA: D-serine ammonia-lyase [Woeseiaceae bacterium]|nr:D-serine ammonia-lyase [Woeseiaceae bacterium]
MHEDLLARLRDGRTAVWMRGPRTRPGRFDAAAASANVAEAEALWTRFAPALAALFDTPDGSGRIFSPLLEYPAAPGLPGRIYVKADHALPISACVKARGGVFGLLRIIESIAERAGLLDRPGSYAALTEEPARSELAKHTVVVASTGNLGFSIGIVAVAFGLQAEIHMSDCAKQWKKDRLRELGARVVEHSGDYTETVAAARRSVAERARAHFIDDENSRDLFLGYACAGRELHDQLLAANIEVSPERPLVVYLPCGVGGAPGGITYGLRAIYGDALVSVFVEPTDSACMLIALAGGYGQPVSVYDVGLGNRTEADGLAVSRASPLVLAEVRDEIDAVVAVSEESLLQWVRRAWAEAHMKLEPSAAAALAAILPLGEAVAEGKHAGAPWRYLDDAVHVAWTTGGDMMPDAVFEGLLRQPGAK